jgi:chromate reductase
MNILGISGSLRTKSVNTGLLIAASKLLPTDSHLTIHTCGMIPLYNEDLDKNDKPLSVTELHDAIATSDAILIATPEYNHSIPGVLKNTLDWISRPAFNSVLAGKPTGIISASRSFVGGARAQVHLRLVMHSTLAPVFPHTDFLVGNAYDKTDENGVLVEPDSLSFLSSYLAKFVDWVGSLQHR